MQSHGDDCPSSLPHHDHHDHHASIARPDAETKGETKSGGVEYVEYAMPDPDDDEGWMYDQMLMIDVEKETKNNELQRREMVKQREEMAAQRQAEKARQQRARELQEQELRKQEELQQEEHRASLEAIAQDWRKLQHLEALPEARDAMRRMKKQRLLPCGSCYVPVAAPKRRANTMMDETEEMDEHIAAALIYLRERPGEKKKCRNYLKETFRISYPKAVKATRKAQLALKKQTKGVTGGCGGEQKGEENEGGPMGMFDPEDGVICGGPDRHFLCNDCLSMHVTISVDADHLKEFKSRNSRIFCASAPQCNAAYSIHSLRMHINDDAYRVFDETKTRIKEGQIHEEAQKQAEDLFQRRKQENEMDRHKRHVVEKILNLVCPRCARAWVDFNGCCALKCSAWVRGDPNSCCQFCAYCLKDCGQDAHPHVRAKACPGNSDGLFLKPVKKIHGIHRDRRTRMLTEYLDARIGMDSQRNELVLSLQRELNDLNIDPQQFLVLPL